MLDRLKAKDADIARKMFSMMANMRGTKEYGCVVLFYSSVDFTDASH